MEHIDHLQQAVTEFTEVAADRFEALEQRLDDMNTHASVGRGRQTEPNPLGESSGKRQTGTGSRVLGQMSRHSSAGGFDHAGEFYAAVRAAGTRGGEADGRLMAAAASTYGNESSGSDGGFSIPPDFRASIMEKAMNESSLLARCFQVAVAGNSLTVPSSMTVPWDAVNGVQARWEGEGAAISQSKPVLQQVNIRLAKLGSLVPISEELLDDAPAMATLVNREAASKIDFAISNAIVRGTGVGQPLGFLNAPSLVTQTAETSQVADTIVAGNVAKMWARMPVASRMSAVWLVHPDADPQLHLMSLGDRPVYLPPGGFSASPFGMLMGRPVIPHQTCATLGDLGDIMLCDFSQYLIAIKSGGVKATTSAHVWFDQDLMAFKFTVRLAGQPWWSEVTTSRDGSHTMSPFVVLAARA